MKYETIERIRKFSVDRDWDQFHSPANLAKSISGTNIRDNDELEQTEQLSLPNEN